MCLRQWESHGQTTTQVNADVTRPPAGDSIVRRTITLRELPIVASFQDAEPPHRRSRTAGNATRVHGPGRDRSLVPIGDRLAQVAGQVCATTSTGSSVTLSTWAVSLPTYGSPVRWRCWNPAIGGNGGRARGANASHYAFNILLARDGHWHIMVRNSARGESSNPPAWSGPAGR